MSVTSSRTPTQHARRHRYPIMGGTALVLGVDIPLAPHTTATGKTGPEHLNPGNANWPDTSATGARNLPSVDGLARHTNHEPAGADTAGSCNPATSGMPWTSKAIAKPSRPRTTPEQPTG
ncbi:hypothetical protein [Streptomyces sp. NPDC050988]|uniref:hypothetical protein n=1 Tax=Streptomyces sp. NPDC050988 TaxID=3365637 RepID=UPI0037988B68